MKNWPFDDISSDLLAKYFADECTLVEKQEIEAWSVLSTENQEALNQAWILWVDTGIVDIERAPPDLFDVDRAWDIVKSRRQDHSRSERSWSFDGFLRIAAILIVTVGIGFLIRTFYLNSIELEMISEAEVMYMTLPDNSEIVLNEGSRITYAKRFERQRSVTLTGEAFFDVEHNPEKPFQVVVQEAIVTVLGTEFNIRSRPEEDSITVFVSSGKVSFSDNSSELILSSGEKGTYLRSQQRFSSVERPRQQVEVFWKTKELKFDGNLMSEVIEVLESVFHQPIILANQSMENCRLTVTFKGDSLQNILDIIGLTLQFDVEKEGDQFRLIGEGCSE